MKDPPHERLKILIQQRKATVGVIGLGYVGLPLVHLFATRGFKVIGFDTDRKKIDKLRQGISYIGSITSKSLRNLLGSKRFFPTNRFWQLRRVDVILICVPTPLTSDSKPDLSYVRQTAKTVAQYLREAQLVILVSTTYPGTTREVILPELRKTKFRLGRDFFCAYSPEREDPGNRLFTIERIPKIVGSIEPVSQRLAQALFERVGIRVVPVSSCEVAEASKILENVYRCVNIAAVNELKMLMDRMGIDIWEVIRAASTKPFGFEPFYPGPGMGGHCIPIDPFYLSWKARQYNLQTRFIELAGQLNTEMPYFIVEKLQSALQAQGKDIKGANLLILGLAYKRDTNDPRESPAFKIIKILQEMGALVSYHDPYIPTIPKMRAYNVKAPFVRLTPAQMHRMDGVIIVTDHSNYDYQWIVNHSHLVVDTRNATGKVKIPPTCRVIKA